MNVSALFKISYGLFVASVECGGRRSGCIINTASQVTAEPPRVVVTMQKSNFTSELIREKGSMAVSILTRDCPLETIAHFGYHSSRELDKFSTYNCTLDCLGNPYLTDYTNAYISLKVEQTLDVGTHWLFLCRVEDTDVLSDAPSITYEDYRLRKSGKALDTKPTQPPSTKSYVCSVCHYVYDGDIPFEELPDDYVCPICGVGKSMFIVQ